MRLKGKVALVTGAGQGIGRAIALKLAGEGADIVICDVNAEAAGNVAREIQALGRNSLAITASVSNVAEVNKMVEQIVAAFNRIDVLVNNAGIIKSMPVLEMPEAVWDSVIETNLKGQFVCSQAVGRQMVKQGGGKIVNIASIVGRVGSHGQIAYAVSKGGVLQLTRGLAVEWARYNINVNSVSPGATATAMMEKAFKESPATLSNYLDRIPTRRLAQTEDIANAVLFLVSPEANDITGHDLVVDGGTMAYHPGHTPPKD